MFDMYDTLLYSVVDHALTAMIAIGWLVWFAEPLSNFLAGVGADHAPDTSIKSTYNVPWDKPWYANDNWR